MRKNKGISKPEPRTWIVSIDYKKYDYMGSIERFGMMDWKNEDVNGHTISHFELGEHVYIYCNGPKSGKIQCRAVVIELEVPKEKRFPDKEFWVDPDAFEPYVERNQVRFLLTDFIDDVTLTKKYLEVFGFDGVVRRPRLLSRFPHLVAYLEFVIRESVIEMWSL